MTDIAAAQKKVKPKVPKIEELIGGAKSLILATLNEDGTPASSYAPFVQTEGGFQILVSYMAKHTRNLRDRKSVSVMVIQDESAVKQIYARDRLTMECEAVLVEPESDFFARSVKALEEKHGNIVKMLSELKDFVLFDLRPLGGNYVNGFGSAYTVNQDLTVNEHLKGAHGVAEAEEAK